MKKVKDKVTILVFLVIILTTLAACSSTSTGNNSNASNDSSSKIDTKPLSKDEFVAMYSDVKKYKGRKVDFYAKIFTEPERDSKGTYFQCYANNKNNLNTAVGISDSKFDIKNDDVVHIVGTVSDSMSGKNALGGEVSAPVIKADKIEKSDYATAFSPAIKSIDVNKEINQNGYLMKLNKVEIAVEETRIYITITNNTSSKINFYEFNSKLTQGSSQFDEESNYESNYQKVNSDILTGVKSDGVLTFKAVNPAGDNLKIILEGSSDNYEVQFKPFQFDISLK